MPKNQITEIIMSPKDWCDTEDIGIYPITLNTLRIDLGASAKGEEFEIQIPAFEACYTKQGGITSTVTDSRTVKVYPNPVVGGQFTVALPVDKGICHVGIYNNAGLMVSNGKYEGCIFTVSAEHLQAGIYYVRVVTENDVYVSKIIIK
ncbi:MAG: T9SS type A sorting domain-containing protein, partial [Bacteroidetes bacterium]|nr:T9SS type A sorting domain-containing protein [Candidatus Limisoma faecipullorum]